MNMSFEFQSHSVQPRTSNNSIHSQETVLMTEHLFFSFFCKPPNDSQIYFTSCEETAISFKLTFEFYINNNNNSSAHNLYEFIFSNMMTKNAIKLPVN